MIFVITRVQGNKSYEAGFPDDQPCSVATLDHKIENDMGIPQWVTSVNLITDLDQYIFHKTVVDFDTEYWIEGTKRRFPTIEIYDGWRE